MAATKIAKIYIARRFAAVAVAAAMQLTLMTAGRAAQRGEATRDLSRGAERRAPLRRMNELYTLPAERETMNESARAQIGSAGFCRRCASCADRSLCAVQRALPQPAPVKRQVGRSDDDDDAISLTHCACFINLMQPDMCEQRHMRAACGRK